MAPVHTLAALTAVRNYVAPAALSTSGLGAYEIVVSLFFTHVELSIMYCY